MAYEFNSNDLVVKTLTTSQDLSVTSIYAKNYYGGDVDKWNSVYTTMTSYSASWNTGGGGGGGGTGGTGFSANWDSTYSTVYSNSANWDIAFNKSTIYSQNSANPTFTSVNVLGDVTITGNLSTLGTITYIDTNVTVTSAMSITNTGTGPAFRVTQTGEQPIAIFYDDSAVALYIEGLSAKSGFVGIGTSTPTSRLDVAGTIKSTEGDSSRWSSAHSTVTANSARWSSVFTSWNGASATSIVSYNDSRYPKLSSAAFSYTSTTSSIRPVYGNNNASGNSSFIAGGTNNNTNNQANTFILGSNITAPSANYTYVNNLCSQDTVSTQTVQYGYQGTAKVYQFYNPSTNSLDTAFY